MLCEEGPWAGGRTVIFYSLIDTYVLPWEKVPKALSSHHHAGKHLVKLKNLNAGQNLGIFLAKKGLLLQ